MKTYLMLLIFIAIIAYGRELQFDANGNLIDPKLDEIYSIKKYYSFVLARNIHNLGYEVCFIEKTKLSFNLGLTHKFMYSGIAYNMYKNIIRIGVIAGYDLTAHAPNFGISITLKQFKF